MEAEKRKRQDDGEVDGKKRKAEEEDDGAGKTMTVTVTDEEVEEFFAILRRIHAAANYLKRRDGRLTAEGQGAITTGDEIETEDLDGVKMGVGKSGEDDSVESKTGFDLNLEPPSV